MVESIIRCPGSFFDKTPSSLLISRFSDDIGGLENTKIFRFADAVEGPLIVLVAAVNICQMNPYLIIAAVILAMVVVGFYFYAKNAILVCK